MNKFAKQLARQGITEIHGVDVESDDAGPGLGTITHNADELPKPSAPATSASGVKHISSKAEFDAALAAAPGKVMVNFSMEGCGACEEEAPEVAQFAKDCPTVTVLEVDVDKVPDVADAFGVEGTPTLLTADSAAGMTPKSATEVDGVKAARSKFKCARPSSKK